MGCKQDTELPNTLPLATDAKFFKFRQTWMSLKQQIEKKPYDPDAEIRNFVRTQEAFYRSDLSNKSKYLNQTMFKGSNYGSNQGSPISSSSEFEKNANELKKKLEREALKKKLEEEENNGIPKVKWKRGDLISSLGRGNVYKGINIIDGSMIVIKSLNLSQEKAESDKEVEFIKKNIRFYKELNHKNIIKYIQADISDTDKQVDILLEFISNGSIRNLIDKYGVFNEILLKIISRQILEGLNHIHSKGISHKNLKCSNLLLNSDLNIKITDFGFINILPKDSEGNPIFNGQPNWTSPEVLQTGEFILSSDIWSIGCILLEMLTGNPPWNEEQLNYGKIISNIREGKSLPTLPKTNPLLENFLKRCLTLNSKERPSVNELLEDPFLKKTSPESIEIDILTSLSTALKNGFPEGFTFVKMESEIIQKLNPSPPKKEAKKETKKEAKKDAKKQAKKGSPPAKSPKTAKKSPAKSPKK